MDGRTAAAGPLHASPGVGRAGGPYDQGGLQDGATDGGWGGDGPRTDRLNAWANSQTAGEWEGERETEGEGEEEGFSGKIFGRGARLRLLFCIHFVRHFHCRQTEQPRSGRGRQADEGGQGRAAESPGLIRRRRSHRVRLSVAMATSAASKGLVT